MVVWAGIERWAGWVVQSACRAVLGMAVQLCDNQRSHSKFLLDMLHRIVAGQGRGLWWSSPVSRLTPLATA